MTQDTVAKTDFIRQIIGVGHQKNGVWLIHRASGAVGECSNFSDEQRNARIAFLNLIESRVFEDWFSEERLREMVDLYEDSCAIH